MEFGIAIAIGLLGSLHCAAMCGPLLLALPVPPGGPARFIVGRIIYQLGRIITYCLLGVVAGLIGKSIFLAGFQRWVSIGLGVAVLAGFITSRKLALSAPVIRFIAYLKAAMSSQLRRRSFRSLALLGVLNGLLPCGLVYVALAGAVSLGSWLDAVVYMALFGLGTTPTMLGIGLSGKMFPAHIRLKFRAAIPIGACVVGILLILRGMGLGIPYVSPSFHAGIPASCCLH